jgi:glycine/D-amino acid oxidase-like deaminating enzyme
MKVAVAGGGIVGLFAAWYLEREGAEVTLFEPGPLGAGSVHAAGIIEPTTAYRTNTFSFLRRVRRFWRNGTCRFRSVDLRWLAESLRQLERPPLPTAETSIRELSAASVAAYRAFAEQRNDFDYATRGLVERFEDAGHFAEERAEALSRREVVPVEVRENGRVGDLFFPGVSWLHTEKFVERMARELVATRRVAQRVDRISLDGDVGVGGTSTRFDAVVAATGVGLRRLGVPLTGLRGYGWHAKTRWPADVATILVDRGIAIVPFADGVKITGGWDFDLSNGPKRARGVREAIERVVPIDDALDFKEGSRPCTPDGLPTIGRRGRLVVATGGFRLGWSFAPGMGQRAAQLALGRAENDPFFARFCSALHSGAP